MPNFSVSKSLHIIKNLIFEKRVSKLIEVPLQYFQSYKNSDNKLNLMKKIKIETLSKNISSKIPLSGLNV